MRSRKLFWLGGVALGSFVLYFLLALRYPIGPSLSVPLASWVSMVAGSRLYIALHLAGYLGLILLYFTALRLLAATQAETAATPNRQILLILVTWLACSGVLMAAAPGGESHDIFDYLFRGRMMAEYQANPLVDVPESFSAAPYNRYLAWQTNVDTYGPVWEATSAAISSGVHQVAQWLGWWVKSQPVCPQSPQSCRLLIVYISAYRLLAIGLTGFSGWIIASMVRQRQASLVPLALAAWLLNPMTLLASAVGGHNDAVMLVLILLGWWLLQRQRPFLALLMLILAAHVKLTALIWLPVCALWIVWRWGWARALKVGLASAACGLVLSWLLYAPFGGWQSLPRMLNERSNYLANSLWSIWFYLLIKHWDYPVWIAYRLSVDLPSWLFAATSLLIPMWMFKFRPTRSRSMPVSPDEVDRKLWRTLAGVSILYLLVGSFWFQHWYILWVLAPAVLIPDSRFIRTILPWLVFGALSSNVAANFLLSTILKKSPPVMGDISAVAMIWGPALLAVGLQALRYRKTPPNHTPGNEQQALQSV